MATNASLDTVLTNEEITRVSPYIRMYSYVVQCKNLGISLSASDFTAHDLEIVHEYYSKIEEVRSKRKGK